MSVKNFREEKQAVCPSTMDSAVGGVIQVEDHPGRLSLVARVGAVKAKVKIVHFSCGNTGGFQEDIRKRVCETFGFYVATLGMKWNEFLSSAPVIVRQIQGISFVRRTMHSKWTISPIPEKAQKAFSLLGSQGPIAMS